MKTNLLKSIFISLTLILGVNNAWGYTAHFSLMGDPIGNEWKNDRDFMINTSTGKTDEWYIYAYVATNQYFALNNGSNQYGPSTNGQAIKNGTGGGQGGYNTHSWKFTGTSGIIKICCAESSDREWYPYVWVEESAPTIKFKHPWNGGSWSEQTATKQNDGTYTYDGKYGNNNGFNAGPSGKYKYNASQTTVEGSPATGDMCRFIWNPVGYVQGGAEDKASGTFKIVKLCSLTYNGNGNTGGTVPSATNDQLYNTSITLSSTTLTKAGYTHTGWNTKADGTGTHYDKGASYTLTEVSATLYAEWTEKTYSLTFKHDSHGTIKVGGTTINSGSTASVNHVSTKTLVATPNTGYDFSSWELSGNNTSAVTIGSLTTASTTIKATNTGATVTANFTPKTYTVTWDVDGVKTTESYTYGATINKPANPTKTGYTFAGWNPEVPANMPAENQTFTATWTINSHTVTWITNGGNWGDNTADKVETYNYGASITKPADPTREGYTFNGWHDGTAIVTPAATMPDNDLTYTAQWEENTYKVTYGVVGAANGTIALNDENPAIKDQNEQDLEHGSKLTFTAKPADGYRILDPQGWFSNEGGTKSLGHGTSDSYTINSLTAPATVFVQFEKIPASTYIVTFNANGGSGTMNSQSFTENEPQNLTANAFTRTGYTFSGWNTQANGSGTSYTNEQSVTLTTAGLTLYAQWTAKTTNITLSQTDATTPGTESVDATYDAAMPSITCPIKNGYAFMGYWDAAEGGKKYYNEDGTSAANWDKDVDNTTLYAHFEKAQIATLTLDNTLFGSGATGYVTTSHTISPIPAGTVVVCWTLCYNNGTPVVDHDPIAEGNEVKFAIDGLRAGTYKVVAELHLNDCNGELLDTKEVSFVIAGNYTVTIQYTCGGETINASIKQSGNPTTTTPATAPEIGGYNFVEWILGDGITTDDALTSKTINYKAAYDGYLTATYEKKKLIFLDLSTLPNKSAWTAPHVYLYSSNDYWDDTKGVGATKTQCVAKAAMVPVPNTTDMWFYEYEGVNTFNGYVAFTATDKMAQEYFWDTEVIYRGDFSSGTPVFVPAKGQAAVSRNTSDEKDAKYYSKGHWTKYMGGTGYTLKIYNHKEEDGRKELMSVPFTGSSLYLPFTAVVDLENNQTYGYKIVRDNDKWYKNDADNTMTVDNHKNWPFIEDNSNGLACGIQTVAAGNYTFTLTLNATTGNLEVSVDYPVTVGDYRVLYKDNTRGTYKPSQIIKADETNPIVGYFVRPGNSPELKVQTAARVSNEGVTWFTTENEIFFKPNANWKSDGARFAAWFSGDKWKDLNKNGDLYSCEIPSGATEVIFCRMDPKKTANNWNNKWNQTGHLSLTTKNLYTLKEGEWGNKLYLKPNSNWTQSNAWFAAYFFETGKTEKWLGMSDNDGDGIYECDIPAENHKNVSFVRMNPANTDATNNNLNWNNKWDQSADQTVPTDGKTLFTVKDGDWNNANGSWSEKEGSWSTITGSITDLSSNLTAKLTEIEATSDAVYTIYLGANGTSIEKVEPYTGNFYIRVDAAAGKWYDYKTNPDNLMTYSAFSESNANSFGEKFSHYKTAWCQEGENVKFVIANDYSQCISDTLVQDSQFNNIDEHGNLKSDNSRYSANIRFMWYRSTNKVSRAYVAAATDDTKKFLVLKANKEIRNDQNEIFKNNEAIFDDTQNWLYERTIKAKGNTRVKLYACYPEVNEAKAQHFRGEYESTLFTDEKSVQIIGGDANSWYTIRVIYDFKTNRLMAAWVPEQNISGDVAIAADVMVIRQHQEEATCITFANDENKLTSVKTAYGAFQLNRWILNNRGGADNLDVNSCTVEKEGHRVFDEATTNTNHPILPLGNQKTIYERGLYFISFPFDVHLSDVFGFGKYGTHWVISTYNGKRRAERGYFADDCINEDCTNWDYIWDPTDFVMEANVGYLLSIDLDLMKYDNTTFWANNTSQVELFFPSTAAISSIEQIEYTMPGLGEEYRCTINQNIDGTKPEGDRRVKDSYWRCIGVPSFANYDGSLSETKGGAAINWKSDYTWQADNEAFPFLYEWNTTDNSIQVQNTSQYKFKSTFAYLIQNDNSIFWQAVNTSTEPNPLAARKNNDAMRDYEWKITLSSNDKQEDQTFLRATDRENVTINFDFNQDLSKEFNYGRSDIYTLIGYERAAANSMPCSENTIIVPLGLDIEAAGDYTIAMAEGMENISLTLVDSETGIRTNLSAGMEYTLTLNKGNYEKRLFIEIAPTKSASTNLEYTNEATRNQSIRKFIIDGKLYLQKDGMLYDAQGHIVR